MRGIGKILGLWLLVSAATALAAQPPAARKAANALPPLCLANLQSCQKSCIKKMSEQLKGLLPSMQGDASPVCARQCRKIHLPTTACRATPKPPVTSKLPSPAEIRTLSPFCRKFLSICVRSCVRSNAKVRDKNGRAYPMAVLRVFCRRRCWHLPARKRICKMKRKQLLNQSEALLRQSAQELKSAEAEEKQEEQNYLRQQAEINRQRANSQKKQKQDSLKQMQAEQWRRMEARRLKQQRLSLRKERKRLQAAQRNQKAPNNPKTAKAAKAHAKELAEEKKRLRLQRKQLLEQQRRLKILKQQVKEKRAHARQEALLEAKRKKEQDKLLQEQRAEIAALRKQRIAQNKRLAKVRALAKKEQQMAAEAKKLALKRRRAKARQKRKLQKRLQQLRKKSKQIGRSQKDYQKSRKSFRNTRKKRRRRLAMLRRKVRRSRRSKRRKTIKEQGQQAFRKGDWAKAKALFKRAKLTDLVEKLREYRSVLANGRSTYDRRNPDAAIPDLERAYTLDLELGGSNSKHAKGLRLMLANMYHLKGRLSLSGKFYTSAFIYFTAARRYVFGHAGANRGIVILRKMATGFFQRAKTYAKNSRYKRKLLRKAVRLVAKNDPLYKKIQAILDKS